MADQPITDPNDPNFDPDVDRYPNVFTVIEKVQQMPVFYEGPLERVEVTLLASGEATARVWPARAEEPEGIHFSPSELA